MSPRIYNAFWLVVALVVSSLSLSASVPTKKEYIRSIQRTFPTTLDGSVAISNKYGHVDIQTWNQDKVQFDIQIIVAAGSESVAQKVFDRIDIEFANGDDFVNATTTVLSGSSFSWIRFGAEPEFKINYKVYMPSTNTLALSNKYGDSDITNLQASADFKIKYGNIQCGDITGNTTIDLGYGKGYFNKLTNVEGNISYGTFKVNQAKDVYLQTKYSKIYVLEAKDISSESKYNHYTIGQVDNFNHTGAYDDIEIETVNTLKLVTKYTDIRVDQLNGRVKTVMKYGGMRLSEVSSQFTEIDMDAQYSDIRLFMNEAADYHVEVESSYTTLNVPDDLNIKKQIYKNQDKVLDASRGVAPTSKITMLLEYGRLTIKD